MRVLVLIASIGWLAACASSPTENRDDASITTPARAIPARSVVSMSLEQLADYWSLGDALIAGEKPRYKRTIEYGCVRVGFGIDTEGRMFDVRVLKSNPQARFSDAALKLVSGLEPEATELNSEKQPMRSEVTLTFANADGEISLVNHESIAKLCR